MSFRFSQDVQIEIDKTREDAENLIQNIFPQRIATFKAMISSPDFCTNVRATDVNHDDDLQCHLMNSLKISELEKPSENKVEGRAKEILGNPSTQRRLNILKPHYVQMHKDFGLLKIWLNYMIPKVEDGNNFGVDVLQAVLERINYMKGISTDFTYVGVQFAEERTKAVKKAVKHPNVPEFKTVIQELDEAHEIRIQRSCQNLYRNYIIAYDLIMKNIEKIVRPRTGTFICNHCPGNVEAVYGATREAENFLQIKIRMKSIRDR